MMDQYVFPQDITDLTGKTIRSGGLTLRQLFAVSALNGMLANPNPPSLNGYEIKSINDLARAAWMAADAMLAVQQP